MEKIMWIVAALFLLLISIGCQKKSSILEDQCVIVVETIAQEEDMAIGRLRLTFLGKHSLTVYEESDLETIWVEPNKDTGISTCEILLFADKTGTSDCRSVKWLHQLRAPGVVAGGPAIYPLTEDIPLKNLLSIEIQSGQYPMNGEIDLATFKGNKVRLKFDKPD